MQRKHLIIAGAVAVVIVGGTFWLRLRGPSAEPTLEKISLRLQWIPQAQFAGYIVAERLGYYRQQGLQVEIRPAGPDLKPQMTVAAGTDDIAVGVSNQVISGRSNGVPLKIIAQLFQDSANRYVLKGKNAIRSLKELRGKKIGLWLGGDEAEFVAMLRTVGMELKDVDVVPQGFTIIPFLQDQYVLSQVTVYNELIQIQDAGYGGDKLQIVPPDEYKAAIVSDMLFTTEKFIKEHKSATQRFLTASLLGWKYCFENPEKAVDIVVAHNPELKKDEQQKQLRAVLGLIWKGQAVTKGLGYMDIEFYSTAERVLFESGQIRSHVKPNDVFDESLWTTVPDASKRISGTARF